MANPDRLGPLGEAAEKILGDRAVQDEARSGEALLAAVGEHRDQRGVERAVEIGRRHHDIRRFAAQFQIDRSEEHTSELQSLMRISYAVFCLKKKINLHTTHLLIFTQYTAQ